MSMLTVAAIQAAPIYLNPSATAEKALALMRQAASAGAELCVFPETFLSGYPVWLEYAQSTRFGDEQLKAAYAAYLEGAVWADGEEITALAKEAERLGLFVYLGFVEKANSGGTVYCSLAAIHPDQGVLSIHRKLMPTHQERLVWGTGDGHGLQVHLWRGLRIGGLNCWENWMPLARFALYAQGSQIHVATWPGAPFLTADITRFVALEGRVFAISAGGLLRIDDIPTEFPLKSEMLAVGERYLSGGTMIVAPTGEVLAGPVKDEERVVTAKVNLQTVIQERQNFDPAGHYHRPDVFKLRVDRRRLEALQID